MENKLCEYCGKEHQGVYGSGRFCSQKCARRTSGLNSKNKIIQCIKCGNYFEVKLRSPQKICNQCKSVTSNKQIINTGVCKCCLQQFKYISKRHRVRIFCSRICQSRYQLLNWYKHVTKQQIKIRSNKTILNRIQSGGKTQWYQIETSNGLVKVQGTFEKRVVSILQKWKKLEKINNWEYNKLLKIQYKWEDESIHHYNPDFKVYTNQDQFYLIQVKGYKKYQDDFKWDETIKQGFKLIIWFQKDIIKYEQQYVGII